MSEFDEDPLDLLEDDNDGIIEILTLLDLENEEKPILERTGCLGLLAVIFLPFPFLYFGLSQVLN